MARIQIFFISLLFVSVNASGALRIVACNAPLSSALNFDVGIQSDVSKIVIPSTADNPFNACFKVTGNNNASYIVYLPSSTFIKGPSSSTIVVNSYSSGTQSGIYRLDGTGTQFLYVGATRAALTPTQTAGGYSGTLSVSVRYTSGGTIKNGSVSISASVIRILAISSISNLNFAEGVQGDAAKVVPSGSSENVSNGSFAISGEPFRTFSITLPSTALLTTGGGVGPERQIQVSNFTSTPSIIGALSSSGTATLFVGAMRNGLLGNQVRGSYIGTYPIAAVY